MRVIQLEFKKIIIILSITVTIMISLMFGVSYGWYAYSNAESRVAGSTIKEAPTVIFSQTEYIYSNQITPIYDEDRYNYANKNSFSITLGTNLELYETGLEISLKDIAISSELKIPNYKYELLQDGNIISSGDFSTIGSATTLTLQPMTLMKPTSYPYTYNYELYIWLSEDETNQNALMNKGFSAKVSVNSAIKK